MKNMSVQYMEKASALLRQGESFEAARLYRAILKRAPGHKAAADALRKIYSKPGSQLFAQDLQRMQQDYQQGAFERALERAEILTFLQPGAEALHNFAGAAAAGAGQLDVAVGWYDKAIKLRPDYGEAHANRGAALRDLKRFDEAVASCDIAIRLDSGNANAQLTRGLVAHELGRIVEAIASYDRVIALQPQLAAGPYNRANAYRDLRQFDHALADYEAAIRIAPDYRDAWSNMGNVLMDMGHLDEALVSHDRALALAADHAPAHFNRAAVLQQLKRFDEAAKGYEAALRLDPQLVDAAARLYFKRANMCEWPAAIGPIPLSALGIETAAVPPFSFLALEDDADHHLSRARKWSSRVYGHIAPVSLSHPRSTRIRIGYFSSDFQEHATMHLMARLFELHDRDRFEVHAFSYGVDQQDRMRQRLVDAVEYFHDVREAGDEEIAILSRRHAIDIAVDLKGYTQDRRSGIFAHRAAPVQIAYLGYPGSMGADFIDYIIADQVIIPPSHRKYYQEKVVALPHSYQVNDDRRPICEDVPSRAALSLPDRGFVFCCFNASYKITPVEFDIWMRCLTRVDGSVLWLLHDNIWAVENLREAARARGVSPDRLVFADRLPSAEHLARHRCADLFLDTFDCNAHTTASDALWAGLPVVTRLGEGFAARVAGSLLHAVGLPELATDSAEAYEALALDLARDPARLAAVRDRLDRNRRTMPLFDCDRFTADIERAYTLVQARHDEGLAPADIDVPAQG